jgi:DHA3 family tetracycline resistance protein-like MFS transporter
LKKIDSYQYFLGSTFYFRFCWALMTTISMVYMVTVAGLDPLQMVLVGTVLELSGFLFEIPTGVIADVYSRRLSMIIGYVMVGLGYGFIAFFPSFEIILVSQVIWGIGFTFLSGASQAWITDELGVERANRSFIHASQIGQIGMLVGIALCVALATIDLALPILVGSLGLVGLGAFSIWFMDEKNYRPLEDTERSSWRQTKATLSSGLSIVWASPGLLTILAIAFFEGMFSEGYDRLNVPFLIESYEFPLVAGMDSVIWWGVMSAGATIGAFLALECVRRYVDTSDYHRVVVILTVASALLILCVFAFVLAGNFYFAIVSYLGIAILRTIKGPLTTIWLNRSLESSTRATIFSMQAQADGIGQVGGGPILGAIGTLVSIKAALIAGTFTLIPAILLYRRALKRKLP